MGVIQDMKGAASFLISTFSASMLAIILGIAAMAASQSVSGGVAVSVLVFFPSILLVQRYQHKEFYDREGLDWWKLWKLSKFEPWKNKQKKEGRAAV